MPHLIRCGIDFGTSNSLAAVQTPLGIEICDVDPRNIDPNLLPSLIYISRYNWIRTGRSATIAYQAEPEDGRFIRALKSALPEYEPEYTFKVYENRYTLSALVSLLLTNVRQRLEDRFGSADYHATFGRPVSFSAHAHIDQRAESILREAAEKAGFVGISFLSEPEAAATYYSTQLGTNEDRTILVFDFGGGTLDLCVAESAGPHYEMLATAGAYIGGTLLDRIIFEKKILRHLGQGKTWGANRALPHSLFNRLVNPDANWRITETEYAREVRAILNASIANRTESRELRQLYHVVNERRGPDLFTAIESAKMSLSHNHEAQITFEAENVSINEPITRGELRELFTEQLEAIRRLIHTTLTKANKTTGDIDRVLLAGGSSALICTQELLQEMFGKGRVPIRKDLFTSIVSGLAIRAAQG